MTQGGATAIRLTSAQGDAIEETFLDGRLRVQSRSGLSRTEVRLLEAWHRWRGRRVLAIGNRTGVCALAAREMGLAARVHTLDMFHADAVRRNLDAAGAGDVEVRCEPFLEAGGGFDVCLLQASKGAMSHELLDDLIQEAHEALDMGGVIVAAVEEGPERIVETIKRVFGECHAERGAVWLMRARKTGPIAKKKSYMAQFEMTLPGGISLPLRSWPGCFSHRRVDEGGLALAEMTDVRDGERILDIGCGCGMVGLALSRKARGVRVTFLDSHARAIYATRGNCDLNGFADYDTKLSASGMEGDGAYTLAVGNPPYFSDYRIARLFVQIAHRALSVGGRAVMVAKRGAPPRALFEEIFGGAETVRRRGYEVIRAVKGAEEPCGRLCSGS